MIFINLHRPNKMEINEQIPRFLVSFVDITSAHKTLRYLC